MYQLVAKCGGDYLGTFPLCPNRPNLIGRSAHSAVKLDYNFVSREQAFIYTWGDGTVMISASRRSKNAIVVQTDKSRIRVGPGGQAVLGIGGVIFIGPLRLTLAPMYAEEGYGPLLKQAA